LRWVTDYRDRTVGEERAAEMLAAGFAVNHTSNRLQSHELEATTADEWYSRLAELRCPVLVVQGSADPRPLAAVDGMVKTLPRCQRAILPSGHFPWVEDATAFHTTVRTWLHEEARVVPSAPNERY
jgi:pimeloyl-ACP methyl ester carboxylesterase